MMENSNYMWTAERHYWICDDGYQHACECKRLVCKRPKHAHEDDAN